MDKAKAFLIVVLADLLAGPAVGLICPPQWVQAAITLALVATVKG